MAVSPPFAIAETVPSATDLVSQYPGVEQTFRDVVESWLAFISDPTTGLLKPVAFPSPFELESTDTGALVGPTISLYRNSASPAVLDVMGGLQFYGEDSAGNKDLYAQIAGKILDPISGSEDGTIDFSATNGGVLTAMVSMSVAGISVLSPLNSSSTISASGHITSSAGNVTAAGVVASGQVFQANGSSIVLAPTGAGAVYLRPNGAGSGVGEATVDSGGVFRTKNNFYTLFGGIEANSGAFGASAGAGGLYLRPHGIASGSGQAVIDGAGNVVFAGNVTAFSDRRYKENIQMLDSVGEMIDAIIPVSFTYTESGQDGIGFIAQDFQEVFPELVIESETGTLSLAYGNITALLWREAQDVRARLAILEGVVNP